MRTIVPLTIAGALCAAPLHAEPRSAVIAVSSSELATPAGTARLHRRIAAVIEQVCGSYATIESYQIPEVDECRDIAWKSVKSRIAALTRTQEIRLGAR